ncbi:peptidase inhibitor family I36 protein [Microbacterium sp. RURRCA19A]|uniref:peptidase inhibitor family I36 protein n=1 Tax=Microbacterium sp. RURRCA19A TaxID=1907391 RepID=UPI00095510D3|nr:peptidase inhibitor family I36 protein [Microbacterium sp. RURRCA19A]SIS19439.1 hypothetical protein SAMN05880568_3455 [Microbacterium sp. RURRCA19A]
MKIKSTIAGGFAAFVVSIGIVGLGAVPAYAGINDCPKGYLCIWKDAAYITDGKEKAYVKFQYYIPDYGSYNYEGTNIGSTNTATSIYNNGRYDTAYMYQNTYKRDRLFTIPAGNANWSLLGYLGDNIESGYYSTYN